MTERARRLWAATEAPAAGRVGITGIARATGMALSTIRRGLQEVATGARLAPGRSRRPGSPACPWTRNKKELVGDFKNGGRQGRQGQPTRLRVHDFLIPAQGKAIPCGVYDLTRNARWVRSLGNVLVLGREGREA